MEWLDFKDGKIHDIRQNPDKWQDTTVEIVIEHPDLPEVEEGFHLLRIRHIMEVTKRGNFYRRIRVNPVKRNI